MIDYSEHFTTCSRVDPSTRNSKAMRNREDTILALNERGMTTVQISDWTGEKTDFISQLIEKTEKQGENEKTGEINDQ